MEHEQKRGLDRKEERSESGKWGGVKVGEREREGRIRREGARIRM